MPTQDFTYVFLADAQSLADAGLSSAIAAAWSGIIGNPLGCVSFTTTTNNLSAEVERMAEVSAITWETLFPACAGKLVKHVQCPSIDVKRLTDIQSSGTIELFITDGSAGGFVSVHGSSLFTMSVGSGVADISFVNDTSGVQRDVNSAYWPSTTPIRVCLKVTITTGDGTGGGS